MIAKTLIAAAALAATITVAMPAQEAKADVDVNIGIGLFPADGYGHGFDNYGYDDGYGYGDADYGWGYHSEHRRYRISCGQGRRIVDRSGFNRVRPVDCELPGYRYSAWKHGKKFMVRVNGHGNITDIRRVY
jgi:hypothetical protein